MMARRIAVAGESSRVRCIALTMLGLFLLAGCGHHQGLQQTSLPPVGSAEDAQGQAGGTERLAGEWEYEESGMTITLILDRFGNGNYDFKDGRFVTNRLVDRVWSGTWIQRENDREGEFEITLTADYREGDGRWWYTRIEDDRHPQKPGGRFHVTKNALPLDARNGPILFAHP